MNLKRHFLPLLILISMTTFANSGKADSVVLGGGCFWCLDASYKLLPGVTGVTAGYSGGKLANPTYEQVCTEETGHAEVVKIDYDAKVTSLDKILAFFWHVHNPTQVGGQGNDMGDQYRSIILYASPEQKAAAEKSRDEEQKSLSDPITTQIVPLVKFWPAEDYHQDYFAKHPNQGYCSAVIRPKVNKLKQMLDSGK
ncbi:MAG TPA: peptide-methionine (S)-S-oxide reductase MsrA [Opitutaceae bacterium]|nr:peptide-methionine (S)-S-oxide reductase MsrA [Opitutaceae bacterium]